MRNRGVVVAVTLTCLSCFSTARYDRAHTQRVSYINARYDAAVEREHQHYISLATDLDKRRASVIPVKPESGHTPVNPVDGRADIVECRRLCASQRPVVIIDPRARTQTAAQCLRDICGPAYADAVVKTYFHADVTWVTTQLAASSGAALESLLAFSHNQSLLADVEQQATVLAQRHARARNHIEQQRQRELQASQQLRASEIEAGRAARRARVKAAADAFAAEARGPSLTTATSHPRAGTSMLPSDAADTLDCAPESSCPAPRPPASVTCIPDSAEIISQATEPASRTRIEPGAPIGCTDDRDCPSGMSCDLAAGACCAIAVR